MSVEGYTRELKSRVEVCKAAGLSSGATEAAAKIVVEKENLENALLTDDKLKTYLKKGGKKWCATLHFLGINNMAYGVLNQSVKNTWLTQQVNAVPKSYTETAKLLYQVV